MRTDGAIRRRQRRGTQRSERRHGGAREIEEWSTTDGCRKWTNTAQRFPDVRQFGAAGGVGLGWHPLLAALTAAPTHQTTLRVPGRKILDGHTETRGRLPS